LLWRSSEDQDIVDTIRIRLLIAFFLVAFVPLVISDYFLSRKAFENSVDQLSESFSRIHPVAKELGDQMGEIRETLSETFFAPAFLSLPTEKQERLLSQIVASYQGKVRSVYLFDQGGRVLLRVPRDAEPPSFTLLKAFSIGKSFEKEGMLFEEPGKEPEEDLLYQIKTQKQGTRWVLARLDLSQFSQFLRDAGEGEKILFYLVNQRGNSLTSLGHSLVSPPRRSTGGIEVSEIRGFHVVRDYVPIADSQLWLVAEQRLPKGHGSVLLWVCVSVLLGLVGSLLLSRLISKRILLLKEMADQIGGGKLDEPISGFSGNDEIASLARSFEQMRISLKDTLTRYDDSLKTERMLYEKVRQRLEEISTLHRIAISLSSTLSLEEVMQQALREMSQTLKAESGALFLWNESERILTLKEAHGFHKFELSFHPGEGIVGDILVANTPLLIEDIHETTRYSASTLVQRNTRSFLGAPLLFKGKCIGTVELHHPEPHFFKEDALKLFEVMVSSLAMAIDHARLYEEICNNLEQRMVELFTLYDVSQVVSSSLDLHTILNRVLDLILQTLKADAIFVTLVEQGDREIYFDRGIPEDLRKEYLRVLSISKSLTSLNSGVPILLRDVREEPEFAYFYRLTDPVESLGIIPIMIEGKLLGNVGVFFHRTHLFTDEEARLLFFLANQVAIALKNARLYNTAVEEKEKLNSILTGMSDGVITLDKQSRILTFNPAAEKILGWREKEVVGEPFSSVFRCSNEHERFSLENMLQAFSAETKGADHQEFAVEGRDGSEKILSIAFSPLREESGELLGIVAVFRDVSKLKEFEQLKSNFISTVSHELRTPLTSIKGYIATLLHPATKFDVTTQKDFLQIMNREADRLSSLITDLLEVSKIESQKFRMNPQPLDLVKMVTELVEKYREIGTKHRVDVQASESLQVKIDRAQIEYVLHHLLGNAVKYSPKGGTILVEVRGDEGKVYVSVQDQGIGIPFDEQEKIFDRFHRVDNRPTRWAYGWGLGLFIARKVIEAHGGHIWVESALGGGSKFTFTLPRTDIPSPHAEEASSRKRRNVLKSG